MASASSAGTRPRSPPHDERGAPDSHPLVPVGPLGALAEGGDHHVQIETRPPSLVSSLQPLRPYSSRERVAAEGARNRKRRERHRPGAKGVPYLPGRIGVRAAGACLRNDESAHKLRMVRRGEEGRVTAERLSNQNHRRQVEPLDRRGRVLDVRAPRDIRRATPALAVTALLERKHTVSASQASSRLAPLVRVARQPVEEEHGVTVAAVVETRQLHSVALEPVPDRAHWFRTIGHSPAHPYVPAPS